MGLLRSPTGDIVSVPDEQVGSALATGYTNVSPVEAGSTIAAAPAEDNGLAGAADAAATSTLSGATLGASDVALKYLLSKGQAKTVSADRAAHPYISGAGQIAGTILPALAAPESLLARSPAGLTSSLGRALAERAGVGEAGLAARAAIHAGSAAAEGAIYGGGQYLTDVALDDNQPLSVEGFVGSVGNGALFAAPVGGAFTLGEGALIRARSLFPRGEVTSAAANGIQKEATSTLSSAIGDGDQMAQQVRQQVALNNANKGVAQSNEQITRRAFGGADPATIVDQAAAGADSTQLSEALHAYDQSRAQLLDWVHAEADPDLEAALSNLRAPGVQGPGANGIGIYPDLEQSLENLRAPHSVQSRDLVPQGEFGAPGKGGIKSPEELLQAAADAGAPEPTGQPDATRAGRPGRLAQGTPVLPEPVATSPAAAVPESSRVSYQVERHGDPIDGKFEIKGSDGSSKIIDRSEMDDWVDEHLPKGFSESGINTRAPFALESGIPSAGSIKENAIYVVRPSELADRGVFGAELHSGSVSSIDSARSEGKRLPPVLIDVTPEGKLYIEDGNHRVNFAARADDPVAVRFKAVSEATGWKPREGDRDVSGRIRELLPKADAAPGAGQSEGIPDHEFLRQHSDRTDGDYYETTVPASAIRERGYYEMPGQGEDKVKADRARQAIREGQKDAIKLNVSPTGKITVTDGRNRLSAALEQDKPIKVKWSAGFEPAPSDVLKHGAAQAADSGSDDLEALLRGTKSKLEAGASMRAVGDESPAKADYVANKLDQRARQAEEFRAKANDEGYARSGMAAQEREAQAAAAAERERTPTVVGGKVGTFEDLKAMFDGLLKEPPKASALHEPSPHTRVDAAIKMRMRATAGEHLANETIGKTIVDHGMRGRVQRMTDDEAIAKLLGQRVGKDVNMGAGLARAARAIGDFEAASADLAEALGKDAPPGAVERAQGYRAATADQADAFGASSARGAEGLADHSGPPGAADATSVDDDIARTLRKHDSATAGRGEATTVDDQISQALSKHDAKATLASQKAAARAAKAAANKAHVAGEPTPAGLLGKATKAGAALEVLKALGAHVPSVAAIPVIGPILSLYLKAKAVMGILGRKGGSIDSSIEGVIASRSSAVRDRLTTATGKLLETGAKASGKASEIGGGAAAILAHKLFPGGDESKSKDPVDLYHARMDDLSRALAPGAVDQALGDRMQTADPRLQDAIAQQYLRGLQFLYSKAPHAVALPGMLPGDGEWQPSKAQLNEWAKYVHYVGDPVSVIEDLSKGIVTVEGAETLRTVYPQLYTLAQQTLIKAAPEMQRTLPYTKRVAMSIMFGVPVDSTLTASHMSFLSAPSGGGGGSSGPSGAPAMAAPPGPSAPGLTGPVSLGQQTMTSLDRRAGA